MTRTRFASFDVQCLGARVLLVVACGVAGLAAQPARADVVTAWNEKAIELLPRMGKQGPFNLRGVAMMHVAMFDAVNAVERGYSPFKVERTAPQGTSSIAAAAAAARRILLDLVPQEREAIDAVFRATLEGVPEGEPRARGVALGEDVAAGILQWRAADRSDQPVVYVPRTGPGFYVATSAKPMIAPHWGRVAPWTLTSGDEFRPGRPPALDSGEWKRDVAETMALGSSTSGQRSGEQTIIARFHSQAEWPVWNDIARSAVAQKRLGLAASARLFALLNSAMADAHIAVYDAKYAYHFWRPVTAIHAADAAWEPLISTPMHPEYPCAHCTLGAAARAILESEFGTAFRFSVGTEGLPGTRREYADFASFAEEEAYSRILGGIHYRTSLEAGSALGRKIGKEALARAMRPAAAASSGQTDRRAVPAGDVQSGPRAR